MNIGIDVRSMFGTPTGVGRYVSNLLRHLSHLNPEQHYWLYTDCQVDAPIIPQANFHQKSLRLPFAQNYFTWNHFRLPPELLLHPVDLFHFPFYTIPIIRNYKSIVTIHDITYEVHPEWYSWKGLVAMRPFSRYAARHADKILTDSNYSKQDLMKYYNVPEEKIVVTYLGVEEWFRPIDDQTALDTTRAKYRITSPQMILYVGSIHTRRNIIQLLQAFQKVQQTIADVQLVLVGKQEYPYMDLQVLIHELGPTSQVILAGYLHIYDPHLLALYNLADLFIYPSSYEGFGLPPIEAMACGTPVITSNNTSLPEVTGDAAILIDPLNIDEMAEAMIQVLMNQQMRQEMIAKGINQAQKFSWEQVAKETLAVYQEVLGLKRS
jgi:glycosyltransferase involved in cell wall biosynthesis